MRIRRRLCNITFVTDDCENLKIMKVGQILTICTNRKNELGAKSH